VIRRRKWGFFSAMVLIALVVGATLANAELSERGNLFVKFDGGIAPQALPRHDRGPIAVRVEGIIRTLSGERPPALRQITIAVNRGGSLDTEGLPVCRRRQLEARSSEQALRVCGNALVGQGHYEGAFAFPEQSAFPLRGRILAFNAVVDGKRAILAHAFGSKPFPATRIITFHIRHSKGTFGTVLVGNLPASLNRSGYLKEIKLVLHRSYVYRGQRHSYLGAKCSAPAGTRLGVFAFARVSMAFADGRKLASTLIRSCNVKEPRG
jgi:hypothetical protein